MLCLSTSLSSSLHGDCCHFRCRDSCHHLYRFRDRNRDCDRDRNNDPDYNHDSYCHRDRDREKECECELDRDRDRDRDRDIDVLRCRYRYQYDESSNWSRLTKQSKVNTGGILSLILCRIAMFFTIRNLSMP